jgi:sucrose phosphorylase
MGQFPLQSELKNKLGRRFEAIYGKDFSDTFLDDITREIILSRDKANTPKYKWNEKDIILITYGDSIIREGEKPLQTLNNFLSNRLKNITNCVHILPFFPYSSDEGFSVIDYYDVNPELGDWNDIKSINRNFHLMADLVINHVSQKSKWFQNFLQGKSPGKEYFIEVDPATDLSMVTRPRSSPLLTEFKTKAGKKFIWTTFSSDQADLNFSNPEVLLEIIRIMLYYISNGVRIIRLDAIAFIWKKPGTSCLHLPEVHEIIKLIREILEFIDPGIILLTETNVSNRENLSYFGNDDEANMIYQFSLPPLLLHALNTGNSFFLTRWASEIPVTSINSTYLNFTASHDGIGVRPLEGLLPQKDLSDLLETMINFGAIISNKTNNDGSESPYEINITCFDALKGTVKGEDNLQAERFICSQVIMMAFKGIPAFYIHSLFATHNNYEGFIESGKPRSINRKKLYSGQLERFLEKPGTQSQVFNELIRIIKIRKNQKAFHPDSAQKILSINPGLFCIYRQSNKNGQELYSVSNISDIEQVFPAKDILKNGFKYYDLLKNEKYRHYMESIRLKPYQTVWLTNK